MPWVEPCEDTIGHWTEFDPHKVTLIRGVTLSAFRCGETAMVAGVVSYTPEGCGPRDCFAVVYSDGFVDHVPVMTVTSWDYEVFQEDEGNNVRFPLTPKGGSYEKEERP